MMKQACESLCLRWGVIRKLLGFVFLCLLLIFTSIAFIGCGTAANQVDERKSYNPPSPPPVKLVSIEASNYKETYFAGEDFTSEGTVVIGTYEDETTADVTAQAEYSGYESEPGTHKITVVIKDVPDIFTEFEVEVLAVELTKIEVTNIPAVTQYVNTPLNISGLMVKEFYSNGAEQENIPVVLAECEPQLLTTAGTQTITITRGGKTAQFNVTVAAKQVTEININHDSVKKNYYTGDTLEVTNLILDITYNNGETEQIKDSAALIYCFPQTLNTAGAQTITVEIGGQNKTFAVNVTAVELTSIAIISQPAKTEYFVGEDLDVSGLKIEKTYNNGNTKIEEVAIANISGFDSSTAGNKIVIVTVGDKTAAFAVNITAMAVESLSVAYNQGSTKVFPTTTLESLKDSLIVTANKNNGTARLLEKGDYNLSGTLEASSSIITVTYLTKTATFNVTVTAVTLDSIAITASPNKTEYYVGETLDITGLVVKGTYNNGSTKTEEVAIANISGFDSSALGTKAVTVTIGGKTATFSVNVTAVVLNSITITAPPTKTEYFAGDNLDINGLQVKKTYNNGVAEIVTVSVEVCAPQILNTAGTQTITITMGGKSAVFSVNVTAIALDSLSVKYAQGVVYTTTPLDNLKTNLQVTANNNNGTSYAVSDYTLSGNLTTAGAQTVTVKYAGKTATFNVIVTAVALESIKIENQPNKKKYLIGESLETAGIKVLGIYNDSTTKDETLRASFSDFESSTVGTKIITITVGDKSAQFEVQVTYWGDYSIQNNTSSGGNFENSKYLFLSRDTGAYVYIVPTAGDYSTVPVKRINIRQNSQESLGNLYTSPGNGDGASPHGRHVTEVAFAEDSSGTVYGAYIENMDDMQPNQADVGDTVRIIVKQYGGRYGWMSLIPYSSEEPLTYGFRSNENLIPKNLSMQILEGGIQLTYTVGSKLCLSVYSNNAWSTNNWSGPNIIPPVLSSQKTPYMTARAENTNADTLFFANNNDILLAQKWVFSDPLSSMPQVKIESNYDLVYYASIVDQKLSVRKLFMLQGPPYSVSHLITQIDVPHIQLSGYDPRQSVALYARDDNEMYLAYTASPASPEGAGLRVLRYDGQSWSALAQNFGSYSSRTGGYTHNIYADADGNICLAINYTSSGASNRSVIETYYLSGPNI